MSRCLLTAACVYSLALLLLALFAIQPLILGLFLLCGFAALLSYCFQIQSGLRDNLAGASLGFLLAMVSASIAPSQLLDFEDHPDKTHWVLIEITSDPRVHKDTLIFTGKVRQSEFQEEGLNDRQLQVFWQDYPIQPLALTKNSQWRLPLNFSKAQVLQNPGVMSKASLDLAKGIAGEAEVESHLCLEPFIQNQDRDSVDVLAGQCVEVHSAQWLGGLRAFLAQQFHQSLESEAAKAFAQGLFLGNQSGLEPFREQLSQLGISHLFAVSGMHISMMFILGAGLGFCLWRLLVRLWYFNHWPLHLMPKSKTLCLLSGWLVALIYAQITGFALPAQRAMLALTLAGLYLYWFGKNRWSQAFSFSLIGVLLVAPYAPLSLSFWFSFLAICCLILLFDQQAKQESKGRGQLWSHIFQAQFILSIGLLPLSMLIGEGVHLASPLINFLVIPMVQVCFLPLLMLLSIFWSLGFDVLANCFAGLLNDAFVIFASVLDFFSKYYDHLLGVRLSFFETLVYVFCLILFILPSLKSFRWVLIPLVLVLIAIPAFLVKPQTLAFGEFKVHHLDVGQGSSLHIQTQNHHVVYDLGPKPYQGLSATERVLKPYFGFWGIKIIDVLVQSHEGHTVLGDLKALDQISGGSTHILNRFVSQSLMEKSKNTRLCYEQSFEYDGVRFEFFSKLPEQLVATESLFLTQDQIRNRINNQSCLLRVSNQESAFLATGDIENNAMEYLVTAGFQDERIQEFFDIDHLQVPSNGSLKKWFDRFYQHDEPKFSSSLNREE